MAAVLAMLAFSATANADAWRPVPQSCVSSNTTAGACKAIRAGEGAWQIAVAPGGLHAYGIAWGGTDPDPSAPNDSTKYIPKPIGNSLVIFDRNPSTGALTQRGAGGCLSETGSSGACVKARGLLNPVGIVVSPDGNQVYVASNAPGGVATFDRNPVNGDLVQKAGVEGCTSVDATSRGWSGPVCTDGRAMAGADTLAITPDGTNVVLGTGPIAVFQRNPSTGVLRQPDGTAGCIEETSTETCGDGHGLPASPNGTRQIAMSPDSRSVYIPNAGGNSVLVFDRDPNTMLVTQKDGPAGCLGQNDRGGTCAVEPKLSVPRAVSVSPDGSQVYVSVANGILAFARGGGGRLALQGCVNETGEGGCSAGHNLLNMTFNAVSPDGQTVVAANHTDGYGLSIFDRDAAGNLRQAGDACVTADGAGWVRGARVAGVCHTQIAARGYGSVTFADDGSFIAGSHNAYSFVSFKRDFYPVCQNQAVSATQNVVAAVPLACSDRNGDSLSMEVVRTPAAGLLGGIELANSRIFYNPFAWFLGTDSFTYRATAAGLPSNEATATLNVVPPPPPPPPKPVTVSSGVTYRWSWGKVFFTIRRLVARDLPVGSTFSITCSGKRCPYKTKTIKRSKKTTMNVLNAKTLKKKVTFRAKQTIEFRIAAPGMNTKVLRFKLRSKKQPEHQTYCIPLGGKKVQRTC